jgi:hypothetical protein
LANSYPEFVKTTFAYTYKKYKLTSDQEKCEKLRHQLNPVFEGITNFDHTQGVAFELINHLQDLQHKHDIIHCGYGILNEYVEYTNEFFKYGDLLFKIDMLQAQDPSLSSAGFGISEQEIALKKEIGDIYYYKTMLHNLLGIPHNIADSEWNHQESFPIEILADFIKKFVYYSHELNIPEIQQASYDIDRCFNFVCKKLGTTLEDIIAQNEAKLRKRYPSGTFTSQEAAAKADTNG